MGCDGGLSLSLLTNPKGTIPKRHELVRVAPKLEEKDKHSVTIQKWFHCSLSNQPLSQPLIADNLGNIYNKQDVLNALIAKTPQISNIPSIKFANPLNLELIKNDRKVVVGGEDEETLQSEFISFVFRPVFCCPITRREWNGQNRFCFLSTCGCVFSELALKQVPSSTCLTCGKPFTFDDVIPINPTKEQLPRLVERFEKLKQVDIEGKRLKRKLKDDANPHKKKKSKKDKVQTTQSALTSSINIALPTNLEKESEARHLIEKEKSEAIKGLYAKRTDKESKEKSNWLSRGTFNRYVNG